MLQIPSIGYIHIPCCLLFISLVPLAWQTLQPDHHAISISVFELLIILCSHLLIKVPQKFQLFVHKPEISSGNLKAKRRSKSIDFELNLSSLDRENGHENMPDLRLFSGKASR